MALPKELQTTAWFYSQNPDSDKAREKFQQQLETHGSPAVLVALAEQFGTLPEIALPALSQLVEISPGNVGYVTKLGFAYWSAGQDDRATECLRKAEALLPDDLEVLNLAAALARDDEAKRQIYTRMLERYPGDRCAWENLLVLRPPEGTTDHDDHGVIAEDDHDDHNDHDHHDYRTASAERGNRV